MGTSRTTGSAWIRKVQSKRCEDRDLYNELERKTRRKDRGQHVRLQEIYFILQTRRLTVQFQKAPENQQVRGERRERDEW